MGTINKESIWHDDIYALETDDPVKGGPTLWSGDVPIDGFSNAPIKQLADNTQWLRDNLSTIPVSQTYSESSGDFIPGVTTELVVDLIDDLSQSDVEIHFDGLFQQNTEYVVVDNSIVFDAPIPVGVEQIQIDAKSSYSVVGADPLGSAQSVRNDLSNQIDPTKGAALVGYKLAGAGTVGRTQAEVNADTVSFLDFAGADKTGASDCAVAFAAADVFSRTTGRTIYVPDGRYKVLNRIDLNGSKFELSPNAIIDASESTNSGVFRVMGSVDAEIFTSTNLGTGDTLITTETAHGLAVGDMVLLTSQRACSHPDAGPEWQLGSITSGASHVYFAEPLQVVAVNSATSFTTSTAIIFPSYRTDNSEETYAGPRTRSGIKKINFATVEFRGGTIIPPNVYGQAFELRWVHEPVVESHFEMGYVEGGAIYSAYAYGARYKPHTTRPVDWTLPVGVDHSQFNALRCVSSWYTEWDFECHEDSQSFDQSYLDICSIHPRVRGKSINPHEQGLTTHGNTYGIDIDLFVTGNKTSGLSNRARFANIKATVRGNDGLTNSHGVSLNEFGQTDLTLYVDVENCYRGVRFDKSSSSITDSPEVISCDISGDIRNCFSAFYFDRRVTNGILPNQIRLHDIETRNVTRFIAMGQGYWHGIDINGLKSRESADTIVGFFQFADNCAFNTIRNVEIDGFQGDYIVYCPRLTDTTLSNAVHAVSVEVAWDTVKVTNSSAYLMDGFNTVQTVTTAQDILTRAVFNKPIYINLTNTMGARTLTFSGGFAEMPIGSYLEVINRGTTTMLLAAGAGVTILGATESGGAGSVTRVYKTGTNTYLVNVN